MKPAPPVIRTVETIKCCCKSGILAPEFAI
jgi:hypothetical protein